MNVLDLPYLQRFRPVRRHLKMEETAAWLQTGILVEGMWGTPFGLEFLQSNSPQWSAVSFVGYADSRGDRSEPLTAALRLAFMFESRGGWIGIVWLSSYLWRSVSNPRLKTVARCRMSIHKG